ncbi:hypothetical protein ABZ671_32070 [Micromonospora sp. NPDC006766]|uniref:hypothetical protein n=1 Tax=Micromonospora sp. NPDC006766 TaxID=3154778 RepID=UPI0033CE4AA6
MTDTSTPAAAYPLPEPGDADPRFTYGLLFDIAEVLQRNGFPRPASADWANLMATLGRFLYQQKETS